VAVSSLAILASCRKHRRAAACQRFYAARVLAVACGAGPSGIAAMSSGRAGLSNKCSHSGPGRPVGLKGLVELELVCSDGYPKLLTLNLANPAEKGLLASVF